MSHTSRVDEVQRHTYMCCSYRELKKCRDTHTCPTQAEQKRFRDTHYMFHTSRTEEVGCYVENRFVSFIVL